MNVIGPLSRYDFPAAAPLRSSSMRSAFSIEVRRLITSSVVTRGILRGSMLTDCAALKRCSALSTCCASRMSDSYK